MTTVLILFCIQCLLGAFDNLWHHELEAGLRRGSRRHAPSWHCTALRELLYAPIFIGIALVELAGRLGLAADRDAGDGDAGDDHRLRGGGPHAPAAADGACAAHRAGDELRRAAGAVDTDTAAVDPPAHRDDYRGSRHLVVGAERLRRRRTGLGLYDLFMVAWLGVPQWLREPLRVEPNEAPRTLLVTGATGFIGRAL